MSLETGGRADKIGNAYENRFLAKLFLRLIDEKIKAVIVEPLGEESIGVEYIVLNNDNTKTYYQCKASNAMHDHWRITDLKKHCIFEQSKKLIEQNPRAEYKFISPLSYRGLSELCDRARSNNSPEDFVKYQLTNKQYLEIFKECANAYNLTDGLDGLAASTGVPVFMGCAFIALLSHYDFIAIIAAAMAGALLGFLRYNKPKAQVFMGDTGSLAIGGLLGTIAIMGKFELYLVILAGVFVIECLSVMIQVTSFKLTGKRVFKMSPIHHHFELSGFTERQIVKRFAIASCIFSAVAVIIFELFHTGVLQ